MNHYWSSESSLRISRIQKYSRFRTAKYLWINGEDWKVIEEVKKLSPNPRTWNSRFCSIRKYLKTSSFPSSSLQDWKVGLKIIGSWSQVPLKHNRRHGDSIGVGRCRAVEQILVHETMQRVPEETGNFRDRLLGWRRWGQREQSGPVRVNREFRVRGETGKKFGEREGQTSGFVRQFWETCSRGGFSAERKAEGRKSAGAGKERERGSFYPEMNRAYDLFLCLTILL